MVLAARYIELHNCSLPLHFWSIAAVEVAEAVADKSSIFLTDEKLSKIQKSIRLTTTLVRRF